MGSDKSRNVIGHDDLLNMIIGGDPATGITGLSQYFGLGTSEGLVNQLIDASTLNDGSDLSRAAADAIGTDIITSTVKRLVLDVVKGASTTRDLVSEIEQLFLPNITPPLIDTSSDLWRTLLIFGDRETSEKYGTVSVNDFLRISSDSPINSGYPSKTSPGLAAYIVKPVGITPGTKNTAALSLFMNSIPTIELSRAVPFCEMTIDSGRPAIVDGRLNAPSQLKFIMGSAELESDVDITMASAIADVFPDGAIQRDVILGSAGMELFTAPQLMGPVGLTNDDAFANSDIPSLRPTPVLDPFRPLMSLNSINIDVVASTGFMSFKTAKVDLTLHDRSRMHEIADFVKPDLFSTTEFIIEYGWHHPDGFDVELNPFGALLNAMRIKEKYGIVNSSFELQQSGEVNVSLQLAMKGANEYRTVQVGTDTTVQGTLRDIQMLQQRVAEIRSAANSQFASNRSHGKSVFAEQILEAAQTTLDNPTITQKQRRKLMSVIGRLDALGAGGNSNAVELSNTLRELYGDESGEQKSAVDRFKSSVAGVIESKFKAIDGISPTELARGASVVLDDGELSGGDIAVDPFIDLARLKLADLTALGRTSRYVSFGKVFMKFVAEPIASTGRFDEVQVLFYPMNNAAGAARNRSVASLLIDRDDLKREFEGFVLDRRAANITVGEFQNFINQTFIDNVANPSYGVATFYQKKKDVDGTVRHMPNFNGQRGKDRNDKWATDLEQKLISMGVCGGIFKPPHVDIHIECLPARLPNTRKGIGGIDDSKTLLRIHVFDKVASSYESQGELIRALTDSHLNTIGFVEVNSDADEGRQLESARRIIAAAAQLKLIERVSDDIASSGSPLGATTQHYRIVGGPQELKRFVMSTAPNIIYGCQNSAIITLGLGSIQDPLLSTVNMLRTDRAGSITPNGSGRGGIPLKTIPAKLDISSFGCPLLSFMQQFFVDAQTGTDLDNIYAITQLSHTLEPSSFKSSFSMVPQQAYGKYESTLNKVEQALSELNAIM